MGSAQKMVGHKVCTKGKLSICFPVYLYNTLITSFCLLNKSTLLDLINLSECKSVLNESKTKLLQQSFKQGSITNI